MSDARLACSSARRSPQKLLRALCVLVAVSASACSDATADEDSCSLDDADGIVGGSYTFQVTVDDLAFSPVILKAQNDAQVTVNLTNIGTTPHDLVIDCIATPNDNGCPTEACFPDEAKIEPVEPGASASVTFRTPLPEGIYDFRSALPGDTQSGQFILQ